MSKIPAALILLMALNGCQACAPQTPEETGEMPYGKWQFDFDSFKQGWQDLVRDVAKIVAQKPSLKKLTDIAVLRSAITDHAPLFYAQHLKNQVAGS